MIMEERFSMSMYSSSEDLYKDKAEYYKKRCRKLENCMLKIIGAHKQSSVNWDAMREAETLVTYTDVSTTT